MSDFTDSRRAEQRLCEAANRLHAMVDDVAKARQIKEFASDRRKNLLARYAAPLLATMSVAAAEVSARANPEYQADCAEQEEQYAEAERVLAKHGATVATFDAARSLLSMSKELLRNIPE